MPGPIIPADFGYGVKEKALPEGVAVGYAGVLLGEMVGVEVTVEVSEGVNVKVTVEDGV